VDDAGVVCLSSFAKVIDTAEGDARADDGSTAANVGDVRDEVEDIDGADCNDGNVDVEEADKEEEEDEEEEVDEEEEEDEENWHEELGLAASDSDGCATARCCRSSREK
jgi:hypothetical protein